MMNTQTGAILAGGALLLLGGWGAKRMIDLAAEGKANREKWLPTIRRAEQQYSIPAGLLDRLLAQESRYRTDIITGKTKSRVGALGIAQFMPATARQELGSEAAALDPARAIPGAARYLAKLYKMAGSWQLAVAGYNWGIGNALAARAKSGAGWLATAPRETRDYVGAVYG